MVIEANDDTRPVWALQTDVRAGTVPRISDLQRVDIHLEESVAGHYLGLDQGALARRLEGSVWARDIPAGELLARSALTGRDGEDGGELPLNVSVGSLPPNLRPGERVDVWVAPPSGEHRGGGEATRVLEHVRVESVGTRSAALGDASAKVVLVALGESVADDLGDVLAHAARGEVTLVRVGPEERS